MRVQQVKKDLPKDKEPVRGDREKFIPEIQVKILPSKFLSYPPNSSISYRPYIFGELIEFNESKLSEVDIIKFILKGITTSFPIMDLTYFDYMFISLLRKISSFGGNQFSFDFSCAKCGADGKHTATIDNIDFVELDVPKLPLVITIAKTELHFSPLTVGNYLKLLELKRVDKRISLYAAEVVNLEQDEAEKVIYGAIGEDQALLNYVDEMLYFGVKPMTVKCRAEKQELGDNNLMQTLRCDFENKVEIGSPEVLTRPFRTDRESLRNRVRFGVS